jgi:hypothetical protein
MECGRMRVVFSIVELPAAKDQLAFLSGFAQKRNRWLRQRKRAGPRGLLLRLRSALHLVGLPITSCLLHTSRWQP